MKLSVFVSILGCECHSPVITVSSEDEDTRSRFPEVLGQFVFDGELSFSDLTVLGKPVYVRRVSGHQYALNFNAQFESCGGSGTLWGTPRPC